MKFSTVIFAAGFAAVAVAQSKVTSKVPIPTETSSYTPEQVKCLDGCGSNLSCQAECFGNPAPTEEMVEATTECVAACPKGDGSVAQNDKYSACQTACINKQYFASTLGATSANAAATAAAGSSSKAAGTSKAATATGSASDSSSTGSSDSSDSSDSDSSDSSASASGTGSSDDSSESASATGSAASASSTGAASGLQVAGYTTGAFAIVAALFAL